MKRAWGKFLLVAAAGWAAVCGGTPFAARAAAQAAQLDSFDYVLGTQTIGASYQFTRQTRLVETAQAILDMGSNVLKFRMAREEGVKNGNTPTRSPAIGSLTDLARDEPSHRRVLEMPFAYYVIWTYPFAKGNWHKGFAPADQAAEYRELHDFACYLLKTYNHSGKTFLLGHWEGDWSLRGTGNTADEARVTPAALQGMIDWLNVRQRAIDDAKRDTPHAGVGVYQYTEVNLVRLAMQGRKTVCNDVLPKTAVDFVSYSSYDTQSDPEGLRAALDYIAARLPPKAGLTGRRVFIGEYGYAADRFPPARQDEMSRRTIRAALAWGCPLILYWEMYNNEIDKQGRQRGFWLIDDKGVKQPIHRTHERFYAWARQYVAEFSRRAGRKPSADEFSAAAVAYFDRLAAERHEKR